MNAAQTTTTTPCTCDARRAPSRDGGDAAKARPETRAAGGCGEACECGPGCECPPGGCCAG